MSDSGGLQLVSSRPFVAPEVEPDVATWARVDGELAQAMSSSARHARDALRGRG